ncbi:cyclopropane-fatty-acyl-phospholipid synthase family protein [Micromonospora sp. HUAS LYJ1]|uniref:SAM-dependent methyltransferase n=1 Tax=Micromonospora sp. HUAS LYJ1 TaxID=3061626 RepID=UPI0026738CF8|nr:methyltransferase domain-containing protein [Micromonospora sp. HUAS LYJ1]WKU05704.1 methyltransferase domain-containing protein [Micromonospora sp. HUAS LYJ1]
MANSAPVSTDVGHMYDVMTELFTTLLDGNIHVGYWNDDEDRTPVAEAATRLTDMVTERVDAGPGAQVLDVGCGAGTASLRLATTRDDTVVTGISVSHGQIDTARARARQLGVAHRVHFRYADAMNMPFGPGMFDGAFAIESLIHMPDQDRALQEIGTVLRPGARLVIADIIDRHPASDAEKEIIDNFCAVTQCRTIAALPDKLQRAGFEVLEFDDISANVMRAFAVLADRMRAVRADFVSRIEPAHFDQLVELFRRFSDVTAAGYALAVARRR